MKKALLTTLQFVLFSLVYVAGVILPRLGILPSHLSTFASGTRFEWDGVYLVLGLYVLILVIEAVSKRLRSAAPWTTLALAITAVVQLVAKLGVMSPDRYR